MSFRTYNQVTGADRSDLGGQVGEQRRRVTERLRTVDHVVAVASGKGGVGKSFVTAALAVGAARALGAVGVLDADLKSPTIARLLDARGPMTVDEDGVQPARGRDGIGVISTDLLLEAGRPLAWRGGDAEAHVWRGVLEASAMREFLSDVVWGPLRLLLVDLPPDADRLVDLAALVPGLDGVVMVTIPSPESERSVERAMRAAADAGVRILGVVENMSGYQCADCGRVGPLFDGSAGATLAERFGSTLLATIPWLPSGAIDSQHPAIALLSASVLAALDR